jgi:hypothetical protein
VHGFDLTFCSPKSVSLVRALKADDVAAKAFADAHASAIAEAMEYLTAHAGYTRVHNPHTGERTWCAFPVWWPSPISTKRRGAGIRTCTPTSCSTPQYDPVIERPPARHAGWSHYWRTGTEL